LIGGDISKLVADQSGVINLIENGFGYTSRDTINIVPAGSGFNTLGVNKEAVRLLTHELANEALRARVAERAAEVGKLWTDLAKAGTAAKNLYAGQVLSFSTVSSAADVVFGSSATPKFAARYDSADSRTLAISSTNFTAQQDITANSTAAVTLRLTFDGVDYEYVASYTVKPLVSWNQDAIAAANAATAPNAYYGAGIGFNQNTNLSKLNGLRMIVGQSTSIVPALPTSLGILNSGTSVLAANYQSGVTNNVEWFINYGATNQSGIAALSELSAGTQVVTLKLTYDNAGTSVVTDDKFITRDYTVTVLTAAQALTAALTEAVPGIILNNGEATRSTGLVLPLKQSTNPIAGVTYSWTFGEGSGFTSFNSTTGALGLTRMYTQQKVALTVTVNGAGSVGNTRNFEFRIMPFSNDEIKERIEADVVNAFEVAPRFFDLNATGVTAGSGIIDLATLLNSGLLSEDAARSTITFSLKSAAPVVNLGSGVTDSGKNAIYINSGTAQLNVGSLAINGDVVVEVIGTISLDRENDGKADVVVTKSFELVIFDRSAVGSASVALTSGVDANGSGLVAVSGLGTVYAGRIPTKVTIEVFSGTSTTVKLATIVFEPGKGGFTVNSGVTDTLSFSNSGVGRISAGLTYGADFTSGSTGEVVVTVEYKYYANSVEVAAVLPIKTTRSTGITIN
jgi:hypothetical protein